jgi:hypothetical protein
VKVLAPYRKVAAAGCGLIALALANGLLHGEAAAAANAVLSVATLAGVYKVPNKKPA